MTEDFRKICETGNPFQSNELDRDDDISMVEPQEALWEKRFCNSDGVSLIADPVWKAAPRVKLYKLDGIDRRGNRAELFIAENRNGNPGFAKDQLDKTLASPFLLLSHKHPRIVQAKQVLTRCCDIASAVESYLPQGFLPIVTSRQQRLRQMLASLKKRLNSLRDREIDKEILRMEFAIIPDWQLWSMADSSEGMLFPLKAKLLRIGYGTRYHPGGALIVANIKDDPDFFTQVAEFARFAGAPMLLPKRKDGDGVEKLDLASGMSHGIQSDSFRSYMIEYVNHRNGRLFLRDKSHYDLRMAAAGTLGLELFRWKGMFGKMGVDHNARKFDECYAEYKQKKK